MNDVARTAGVGLKTVSRVVNGEPRVRPETARKVHAAITKLGFRRHEGARWLRQGSTACIGMVLEDMADPFYSMLTRAVEQVARAKGFLVFTGSSEADPAQERELAQAFCARRVDGLVIAPASQDHRYLEPELQAGVVVVFVDRPAQNIDADAVLADNAGGVRAGIAHLLSQGHRRIGFLGDTPEIFTAAQRLRGYQEALAAAGLPFDESLVAMGRPEQGFVRMSFDRFFAGPEPVSALFTGNNRATVAALRELATRTERPALVGFDDFELADLLHPAITVVKQDAAAIGRTAADLLFRRISGDDGPARTIELSTQLIPRGSGEVTP
ncbi:LacI family DNA-binding transcriptional regulator [Phytoactinopolyspora sp. XMNu-373]|uniref:LacI family DNA-binding transcriptional regulator n=2 Tax=Phytoactinopolyspora mesophila TaxID=2650750 RepID=A0A7K3M762_9ACTN|nr:LacI family DNA-binding transcriptional regulator [Phytoactinopolyspora mesophila]